MSVELTKRDRTSIQKDLDKCMLQIVEQNNNCSDPMTEEDLVLFRNALSIALKDIKILNKQKYTPKKYRKSL
jgi:hypothetical protein